MKKYFCFYCQQKTKSHWWFGRRWCADCRYYIINKSDDFYKVCDRCGANLPTDAAACLICGYHFSGENAVRMYHLQKSCFWRKNKAKKRVAPKPKKPYAADNSNKEDSLSYWLALIICALGFILVVILLLSR